MNYYDYKNKKYVTLPESKSLKFLYNNVFGRIILKIMISKVIANIYGFYQNSKLSKYKIKKFIKKNNIDMTEYELEKYNSFNDFFKRKIKKDKRIIEDGFIAPCDSKLLVYDVSSDLKLNIKNSIYTVNELTHDDIKFSKVLVYRLCVDDYHHYIFPFDGEILDSKYIKGKLHTVQPIAQKKYKVFSENSRVVTKVKTEKYGIVTIIEVGAMLIGKIVNENVTKFSKGLEKGHFEFGGSTIIYLFQNDVKINDIIIDNSKNDIETIVKLGQNIE